MQSAPIGVIGASGYSGLEASRILALHPQVDLRADVGEVVVQAGGLEVGPEAGSEDREPQPGEVEGRRADLLEDDRRQPRFHHLPGEVVAADLIEPEAGEGVEVPVALEGAAVDVVV